jgi:RNA polymerase sigma-70 factor (ECF subfamily)
VVRGVIDDPAEAEDVLQDAWVRAFEHLRSFRGEALFSTWLARIAVRVTMHAVRRRPPPSVALDATLDRLALPLDDAGPERRAAARQGLAILDALLAELRPKRRAAFVLHVLEGYSMEEVGAILNASTAAIKVRVHDARRFIEKKCQRDPRLLDFLAVGGEA